jgi:predicted nucleic acid-binding protein
MVVADSSALIPLSRVGRLDLVEETFDDVRTTDGVQNELLTTGKPGTAALKAFLDDATVLEPHSEAKEVASLEGIAVTDGSVILHAEDGETVLLANDKGLITVGRSHDVECWWVTTLLLKCAKEGTLSAGEASDLLYDLVDEGMNLSPQVYTKIQRRLKELGNQS